MAFDDRRGKSPVLQLLDDRIDVVLEGPVADDIWPPFLRHSFDFLVESVAETHREAK